MKKLVLYIHGKGGSSLEANHYKPLFKDADVLGLDYTSGTPWGAKEEFSQKFDTITKTYDQVILIVNSIGAYFAMHALAQKHIEKAYFISPVVNMQQLISDMMVWANVNEQELCDKKIIHTTFGETLS